MGARQHTVRLPEIKRRLVPAIRPLALLYKRTLANKTTTYQCDDSLTVSIYWGEANFIHLVGVSGCNRPPEIIHGENQLSEAMYFYRAMTGKQKSFKSSDFVIDVAKIETQKKKLEAMDILFGQASQTDGSPIATMVVDSSKDKIIYFVGSQVWSIGISRDEDRSLNTHSDVYFPQSMQKVNVLKRKSKEGEIHSIVQMMTR